MNSNVSKWFVDYVITHTAALSLYIDNWQTDIADLRDDLRIEMKGYVKAGAWMSI